MRGQKVAPVKGAAPRRGKSSGSGGGVVPTVSSPAASAKPKQDEQFPPCTGCGVAVSRETRALQCDRCLDKWKCIDCVGISEAVYDGLMDIKDICWFCTGCGEGSAAKTEDRVLAVLEKVMDKLNGMEERLRQKVDVKMVEELERKMESKVMQVEQRLREVEEEKVDVKVVEELERKMESTVTQAELRLREVEEQVSRNKDKLVAREESEVVGSGGVLLNVDEEREIERRKKNLILYRVPEIQSEVAEDRKAGDMAFFHEVCEQGLGIALKSEDIEQMYRLGRRDPNKVRPLLVKCKEEGLKNKMFDRVRELKFAEARFRGISIAQDLTPCQRERVKGIRQKAMEELQAEQESGENSSQLNKKIIVVGQSTCNPRAIRVAVRV